MKVPDGYIETSPGVFCHRSRLPGSLAPGQPQPAPGGSLVGLGEKPERSRDGSASSDRRVRERKPRDGSVAGCPGGPPRVRVTLTVMTRRLMDSHDNLAASCKPLVDAIAAEFGVPDDHPGIRWDYRQIESRSAGVLVLIEVEKGAK